MLPGGPTVTLLRDRGSAFADIAFAPLRLEARLAEAFRDRTGHGPSPAESRSWSGSLPVLAQDILDAGLENVEVLVEHQLPLTSKRVDVILAGRHPGTGAPSYVLVELKQWSHATLYDQTGELVSVSGTPGGPRLHPVAQVQRYCDYLVDFTTALHSEPDPVAGAAYLHNATADLEVELGSYPQSSRGRLFTGSGRSSFIEFLRSRLDPVAPGLPYAHRLLRSPAAPSRQLLTVVADELAGRERFILLDEQAVAFDLVLHAVEAARVGDQKTAVIISGGPGSGKSVIALSLMGELAAKGRTVMHATGSRAFTQTLRELSGFRKVRAGTVFKYFNSFVEAEPDGLDVVILDEAHRIRETSVNRYTRAALRTGRRQVDELLASARVPVFLLDAHQVVRPGELGTAEDIARYARAAGIEVQEISLAGQFRCGGSETYVDWVERLLGLVGNGPIPWDPDDRFVVDIVETPTEMESRLASYRDQGFGARMTAGFCWPWSDPRRDGSLVPDVQIGSWSRPWNLKSDRGLPGAPPSSLWASRPEGFGQVGCVYTAQGFEFDWNGVIIGPDLVWRRDRWVSRRGDNKDPEFRSVGTVDDHQFDRLVRHVYKVLLTRGMVGTLLYSTDVETREMLRSLVP